MRSAEELYDKLYTKCLSAANLEVTSIMNQLRTRVNATELQVLVDTSRISAKGTISLEYLLCCIQRDVSLALAAERVDGELARLLTAANAMESKAREGGVDNSPTIG